MKTHVETRVKKIYMGRLPTDQDLLETLNSFCKKHKIFTGSLNLIGAVSRAKMGYYDQKKKRYTACVELDKKLEIASCMGNISLKDGKPFVHAHVAFADLKGNTYAGHLMPGTKVFAAEFVIHEFTGKKLHREKDDVTGLPLWSF
ncbi:MAG: DNA-binding protein [Endomicrobiales bacterium]|nr:DNA-binding protein [Endomicrobiales bacterium]